ncbi:unnamed protein product, partial [Rotaria sordida]
MIVKHGNSARVTCKCSTEDMPVQQFNQHRPQKRST